MAYPMSRTPHHLLEVQLDCAFTLPVRNCLTSRHCA